MRILGIDPGLEATGYGLLEIATLGNGAAPTLVEAGLIRTKTQELLPNRLKIVATQLEEILSQHRPDLMAVEDLYSHYEARTTAILMGHVRGVILAQAALREIPVVSYLPTRVKKAVVGRGHAPKAQIARMVEMRLGLEGKKLPSDVTDALAVALCHIESHRVAGGRGKS